MIKPLKYLQNLITETPLHIQTFGFFRLNKLKTPIIVSKNYSEGNKNKQNLKFKFNSPKIYPQNCFVRTVCYLRGSKDVMYDGVLDDVYSEKVCCGEMEAEGVYDLLERACRVL